MNLYNVLKPRFVIVLAFSALVACGGSSYSGSSPVTPPDGAASQPPSQPQNPAGTWTLIQNVTDNWDRNDTQWTPQGDRISLDNVEEGSTLVMLMYGLYYTFPQDPQPLPTPSDSQGQAVQVAVDAGSSRYVPATAWVLHNAKAGRHTWTGLASAGADRDSGFVDGKLFFMESARRWRSIEPDHRRSAQNTGDL